MGKMDYFVINCLSVLLNIVLENDFLLDFMVKCEAPNYKHA